MNALAFLAAVVLFVLAAFGVDHHVVQWGLAALAAGHLLGGNVQLPTLHRRAQ